MIKSILDTNRTGGGRRDEIFVDIIEKLSCTFNSAGYIQTSQIDGSVQARTLSCALTHSSATLCVLTVVHHQEAQLHLPLDGLHPDISDSWLRAGTPAQLRCLQSSTEGLSCRWPCWPCKVSRVRAGVLHTTEDDT